MENLAYNVRQAQSLNPCYSGLPSRTQKRPRKQAYEPVLILVIVDGSRTVPSRTSSLPYSFATAKAVLILVVVERPLGHRPL